MRIYVYPGGHLKLQAWIEGNFWWLIEPFRQILRKIINLRLSPHAKR